MQVKTAADISELHGIKLLQQQNLKSGLTSGEANAEGFVTAEYSLDFLNAMNTASPAIIAKDGEAVVGYVLATSKSVGLQHDLLSELFNAIDRIQYNDRLLKEVPYIVVGQLCIAKGYRGIGLVQRLYEAFRNTYSATYEFCITDVAESNPRSLKAHNKTGFAVIDTLRYGGTGWNIVLWDWRNSSKP